MNTIYLEDIEVGASRTKRISYHVTRKEIVEFAGQWDPRPFHLDEAAAASSVFAGIVACSAHLFSLCSWFGTHGENRTAALAAMGFDEIRIHQPVRPGSTLFYTATWLEKRDSVSKPDRGVVRTLITLSNQNGARVFSMIATTLVAKRPGYEGHTKSCSI